MIRNVIFDFVGVIADIDKKKVMNSLSFKDKINTLRLFVYIKRNSYARGMFEAYMAGEVSTAQLDVIAKNFRSSFDGLIPKLSKAVEENLIVNEKVVKLINELRNDGIKVYMLSNSTPETEKVIENHNLRNNFDGLILSTETGLLKPDEDIFRFATLEYNIKPSETFFIDDKLENVEAADELGFKGIDCISSDDAFYQIGHRFYSNYETVILGSNQEEKE